MLDALRKILPDNHRGKRSSYLGRRSLSFEPLEVRKLLTATQLSPPLFESSSSEFVVVESAPTSVHSDHGLTITEAYIATHHDQIPRFANIPEAGAAIAINTQSGNWSDPNIWLDGVPSADARVQIAAGTTVTYDLVSETRLDAVEIHGHLAFSTTTDTRMFVDVLMVMPNGTLTIGTEADSVRAEVSAEIIFRGDTALKTGTVESPGIDPEQYGKGLLAFGKVSMYGRQMDSTFVRLASDAKAGDTTLTLDQVPAGWQIGDRLIVPDTRQIAATSSRPVFTSQAEEAVIAAINGQQITLTEPLAFDHLGPRDAEGNVGPVEQSMLPHIGNLTRNVTLRSENPDEVARRGHTMFLHRADVDVQYAAFAGLGRTSAKIIPGIDNTVFDELGNVTKIGSNQTGRYSIHFHHLWGPENQENTGFQSQLIGSVVNDFMKWGITLHGSHYALVQDNVAYAGHGSAVNSYNGVAGAAIATESGNESFNLIERNFVVHTQASTTQRILGSAGRGLGGIYGNQESIGRDGFWFRGQHNYVRDNVVANAPDFAFNYNGIGLKAIMKVPKFRGANMMDPNQYEAWNPAKIRDEEGQIIGRVEGLPVLKSSGNEAYAATGQGLWISRPQGGISPARYSEQINLYRDYRIWHVTSAGVYDWGADIRNHFTGFVLRNDAATSAQSSNAFNRGFSFGDSYYSTGQLVVSEFDVQGFNVGIQLPHRPNDYDSSTPDIAFFEGGRLSNHINIEDRFARFTKNKQTVIRDVVFSLALAPAADVIPTNPLNIWMHPDQSEAHAFMTARSTLLIYNYNQGGGSFEVYFQEQAPDSVLPPYRTRRGAIDENAPGVGLTNQQAWDELGIAVAGAVAPTQQVDGDNGAAAALRAAELDIMGLVFPFEGQPPLPPSQAARLSITAPAFGSEIDSTTVDVRYQLTGDTEAVHQVRFQLDGGPEIVESDLDGLLSISNVPVGKHNLTAYLVKADLTKVEGSDVSSSFVTASPQEAPQLSITAPAFGSVIDSTTVDVRYQLTGDTAAVHQVRFQLDGGPEIVESDLDGLLSITNVPAGKHNLTAYLVKADLTKVEGSDVSTSFVTTSPQEAPQLSITAPAFGSVIDSTTVDVIYQLTGDTAAVHQVRFQLDGGPEIVESDLDGLLSIPSVPAGKHNLTAYLVKADETKIEGSDVWTSFVTTSLQSDANAELLDLAFTDVLLDEEDEETIDSLLAVWPNEDLSIDQ